MVRIGSVKPFISLFINVQIIIAELIRQIEIAQRRTFYRVIQHRRGYLTPHTPGKSKTGMIPFPLMISSIHQHSDNFLRIETYTQIHRTFRFRLQGQDQILLALSSQLVVHISIGICPDQDRHGFAQFFQCNMAVLLQRTDTMHPV